MMRPDPVQLRRHAAEACEVGACSEAVAVAARTLLTALERAPSMEIALIDVFASLMESISDTYFGRPWTDDHEFSVYARLIDDRRAWGYGSEEEIEPLRWLRDTSCSWYDGKRLRDIEDWEADYEAWAAGQEAMVRRRTPGALNPPAFPGGRP